MSLHCCLADSDLVVLTHQAMSSRNGDYIGDRYVKLLRVPLEEMEEQTGGIGGAMLGGGGPGMGGGGPSGMGGPFGGMQQGGMQQCFSPGVGGGGMPAQQQAHEQQQAQTQHPQAQQGQPPAQPRPNAWILVGLGQLDDIEFRICIADPAQRDDDEFRQRPHMAHHNHMTTRANGCMFCNAGQ